jgi:hypothetical protein
MYDLIGDIHGHADELKELLTKLEYENQDGTWSHKSRIVVFLGDYIDRGPKQRESVAIVRSMVETGNALAIMGNHEFNAIGFSTLSSDGISFLRPHSDNNLKQHGRFLEEFPFSSPEYKDAIAWFNKLPMFLEKTQIMAVHACDDLRKLRVIRKYFGPDFLLVDDYLEHAFTRGSDLYLAIETCLKGIEIDLPEGVSYLDKDGIERSNVRCNWWDPERNTFKEVALISDEAVRSTLSDEELPAGTILKYDNLKPVLFGHYWRVSNKPRKLTDHSACLDYSVANKDIINGKLVAYRLDGKDKLNDDNFIYVDSVYAGNE